MSGLILIFLLAGIVYLMATVGFAVGLTAAVALSGIIALIDLIFFRGKRLRAQQKDPTLIDYCRSFFPVLLIVWLIRSFIVQPYKVPTGSLEPTLMPGEFIGVNQFAYGLKFPVGNYKFLSIGEPKRNDIVLFYPDQINGVIYIKRLVGLPGDHIIYKNKILTINGVEQPQIQVKTDYGFEAGQTQPVVVYQENLDGVVHDIYRRPYSTDGEFPLANDTNGDFDYTVPAGHYFMMGDNRDESADSRYFGPVPERNIIGKAFGIWMSWDPVHHVVRWHRIGDSLLPHHQPLISRSGKNSDG